MKLPPFLKPSEMNFPVTGAEYNPEVEKQNGVRGGSFTRLVPG
jgi:hypothetical protein